ncbi:uncharacterized protein LOC110095261 isoform X1 [Dendrobium catenatum]|uniref:uncharacterized protein LOC110095261 isoform X1 n=2 Tax=Dendrobium catenatum TaxID=906689 RepID=UPI0009F19B3D|nr:uncharacterized protein LOC110095261 isoform X1 [Dendrobium catenatum]
MVRLFLGPPPSGIFGDRDAVKERVELLEKLESVIWSAMVSGDRYEARLWLCNTISSIHSITLREQCKLFIDLLRLKKSKHDVAARLLQMIFENRPGLAGSIIAKKICMLEKFFEGNPRRILEWFDHFATVGESGHKKGARALSKFAFMNRNTCWEELEWKGRHGQSPAVVATKPHYFHDLDVLQTVENFLKYVPDFWSSDELAESVKDGEILKIDQKYFIDSFLHWMYEENLDGVWVAVEEFMMNQQFSFLCQHLLVVVDDSRMLTFFNSISKFINVDAQCKELKHPSCWLEYLLSTCSGSVSVEEYILLNAVISHGRQLLRLMTNEEHESEKQKLEKLLMNALKFCDTDHWYFIKECTEMEKKIAIKLIGLQSWVIQYHLAQECKTQQSCELLFSENGISFRRAEKFYLLQSNGTLEEHGSEIDDEDFDRRSHNRRRKEKKRRKKKQNHANESADELLEFEPLNSLHDCKSGGRSWLLSTNNYSCAWNAADLPDHFAKRCFSTWMKWVLSMW